MASTITHEPSAFVLGYRFQGDFDHRPAAATLGGLVVRLFRIRMPGLLGMLFAGIMLGPYGLNLIHRELIAVSADLRNGSHHYPAAGRLEMSFKP